MTPTPPPLPEGFTADDDLRGGWRISRAGVFVGAVFPVPADPAGRWYARRYGKAAQACKDQQAAIAHLTGVIPPDSRRTL